MTREQFYALKYGDQIRKGPSWIICTVIEPFNGVIDAVRLAWHGQTFLINDPRWWGKAPPSPRLRRAGPPGRQVWHRLQRPSPRPSPRQAGRGRPAFAKATAGGGKGGSRGFTRVHESGGELTEAGKERQMGRRAQ
jgi:hypothetical protein